MLRSMLAVHSFIFPSSIPLYGHNIGILHSPVKKNSNCFQLWANLNTVVMNITCIYHFVDIHFHFS